jgi:four helix bundle protein
MDKIRSFTGLYAWKEAHAYVLMMYAATKNFPKEELFGLTDQLRRAGVSISSNIAEGFSRASAKEKRQFYRTALASLTETQNQLLIARDVEYLPKETFNQVALQSVKVSKLINGLLKSAHSKKAGHT